MSLKDSITEDMKSALKAGAKDRLKVLRLILAAIKQVEVDTRATLDDAAVLGVLEKMVKQRKDSVEQFTKGGRDDLVAIELAEIEVIDTYLPEKMDDAELDALIAIGGVAKGVGMIHPNMATMLAFVLTDADARPTNMTLRSLGILRARHQLFNDLARGFPGHFLVRVGGEGGVVVDPFHGGRIDWERRMPGWIDAVDKWELSR